MDIPETKDLKIWIGRDQMSNLNTQIQQLRNELELPKVSCNEQLTYSV